MSTRSQILMSAALFCGGVACSFGMQENNSRDPFCKLGQKNISKENNSYFFYCLPEASAKMIESKEGQDPDPTECSTYIQLVLTNLSTEPTDYEKRVVLKETEDLYKVLETYPNLESIPSELCSAVAVCAQHADLCSPHMQDYLKKVLGTEKTWDRDVSLLYSRAEEAGY